MQRDDLSLAGAESIAGSLPPDPRESISPEVALVFPELAQEARGQLPDRPWEALLGSRRPSSSPAQQARAGSRASVRRLVRGVLPAFILLSGLLAGLRVYGLGNGSGPQASASKPGAPATSRKRKREATPSLLPSAGFVVSPRGSLLTDRSGRRIRMFVLPLRCGPGDLVIRNISLSGRSFRFSGKVPGRAITINVTGRVLDARHVRGVASAVGATCSSREIRYSARLS